MTVATRLTSFFSLSSLAVLICSLSASPATALSLELGYSGARSLLPRGHEAIARRKRSTKTTKRCKPKAAPSPSPSSPTSSVAPAAPAPSPSPSANSPPPPAPPASSPNGGNPIPGHKFCLAWPNGNDFLDFYSAAKMLYTWSPACPSNAKDLGITCCSMLWGSNQVDQFQQTVNAETPKCVMGFNEPEIPTQSNISPQDGARLWKQYIAPLQRQGVTTISPATTSDQRDFSWLKDFGTACDGNATGLCGADMVAVHYYDISVDDMIHYVQSAYDTFGKRVLLTEFACENFNGGPQCSQQQVDEFQAKIIKFVESVDWLIICPFAYMQDLQGVNPLNQGMNPDGTPNAFGQKYLSLA